MNIYNILEIGESFVHYSIKTYYIYSIYCEKIRMQSSSLSICNLKTIGGFNIMTDRFLF